MYVNACVPCLREKNVVSAFWTDVGGWPAADVFCRNIINIINIIWYEAADVYVATLSVGITKLPGSMSSMCVSVVA